ncbi:MAG: vitamin B12-dependent ribonucleotide reductase [Limnochordales bacterium]|nr:vitamin B12-dependent ribonucleotide reductase [Limnochordales bacterium]
MSKRAFQPAVLSNNARLVLEKRYLRKDLDGRVVETPDEMFHRVARNLALIDILYHPAVYNRSEAEQAPGDFTAARWKEEWEAARKTEIYQKLKDHWTDADLEALFQGYRYFAAQGSIEADFVAVLRLLDEQRDQVLATEDEFYRLIASLDFLPNSPCLMNAGRELQQLSACFVLPVEDSLASIFDSIKHAALIHQSGGGTGFAFSRLRPKNDVVRSTGGVASGPVSFLRVFNAATEAVKQGGTRRGANMGILAVNHPDILEFITCKDDPREITNFNISVAVDEKFMQAVERNEDYPLINPRNGEVTAWLNAREVFNKIVYQAWKNGEPGIIFIDRMNADNPTPHLGLYESTNPCGEQPLLPYEACDLGSVNLGHFVKGVEEDVAPWLDTGLPTELAAVEARIDWERLGEVVAVATHFLDNLIDASRYPLPEIERMHKTNRKIGLGVMGWADMLLYLGVPYNSELAVQLAERVMSFIRERARQTSARLAEERGVFPSFRGSIYDWPGMPRVRNATTTTIAPTGTISLIAGASSGIEPLFSIAFTRRQADTIMLEVNPIFERVAVRGGFASPEVMEEVAARGNVEGLETVPESVRKVFVTAHQVTPEWHIRMQAAFQKFTDNAVSKTCNFPHDATPEYVAEVYRLAYKLGCKGVTVYRDGSRSDQVLTAGKQTATVGTKGATRAEGKADSPTACGAEANAQGAAEEEADHPRVNGEWGHIRPIERPVRLRGFTEVMMTPLGKLFLTLNSLSDHPVELFAQIGKAGSDVGAFTEALARLVSLALRCGVAPEEVAEQLIGIGGSRSVGFGAQKVRSVPDAIGRFLQDALERLRAEAESRGREEVSSVPLEQLTLLDRRTAQAHSRGMSGSLCPECGQFSLMHVEGCLKCMSCGYSEC